MVSEETRRVAQLGQQFYDTKLKESLEKSHQGFFVSIEPDSGAYFLGRTLEEAIGKAREAYPDRLSYTCRVGFPTAIEIGSCP